MPREPLDALENLPKEAPRQVAFSESQGEVPGMSDEPRAGLEKPLLEARQGPALDGDGQDQPAQQIAEVIGDHPEEQPHLVGPEAVAGEPGPVGGANPPPRIGCAGEARRGRRSDRGSSDERDGSSDGAIGGVRPRLDHAVAGVTVAPPERC